MAVLRHVDNHGFTQLNNEMLGRTDMSLKAKGLLSYLLSKPDDWEFSLGAVVKFCGSDGKDSVRSGIKELEELGYLVVLESERNDGRFTGGVWTVSDSPIVTTESGLPCRENRVGKTASENPLRSIYIVTNTERTNTKELIPPISPQNDDRPKAVARSFIDHLNEVTGKRFRVTDSVVSSVSKRLDDGYSPEDLITVIDNMASAWLGDEKMAKYLTPTTLLRPSHFDNYLNMTPSRTQHRSFRSFEMKSVEV